MKEKKDLCACPWCPKPIEPGCFSLFNGDPTCEEHGSDEMLRILKEATETFLKKD